MATPTRRSTRVSKAPDRLAPSTPSALATTPRKRAKNIPSAFASPLSSKNKRQRTLTRGTASRSRAQDTDESQEEEDRSASDASASEDEERANAGSENEEEEDEEDDEDEVSDFENEISTKQTPRKAAAASRARASARTPAGAAKQSKRKAAVKKSKASTSSVANDGAAAGQSSQSSQSLLLNWILDEDLAISQAAIDWLHTYRDRDESDNAVVELVNFFLKLTGCPGQIDADDLYDVDKIPDKLAHLQSLSIAALKKGASSADAVVSGVEVDGGDDLLMGKTKEQRRFRKNALQFVLALIVDGQHHLIFADVNDENGLSPFSEVVIWWLGQMSLSGYRPFRHVATLLSLTMQSAMVTIRSRISVELQTTYRQLEAELSKRPASSRRNNQETAQAQRLRDRVATLTEQDEQAAAVFTALFTTVFSKRAIDIHSVIRAECLVPLATWCREYPAAYLQPTYLRYIGIGLHDKEPRVREACLAAALGPLLLGKQAAMAPGSVGSGVASVSSLSSSSSELVAEGFRPFIVRFLPRLVQMAAGDIDTKVQVAALKLLSQLARLSYLDPNAEIDGSGSSKKGSSRSARDSVVARGSRANSRRTSKRSTFSNPLSQQMLESSDSEDDQDSDGGDEGGDETMANGSADDSSTARESAFANIQPLYDDSAEEEAESDPLPCPRHSSLRYLAPLVAHTHATVRAAAAELVSWWICEDWVSAAGSAAGLSSAPNEGSAEHSWLLFKSLGAFLYHLARMSKLTIDTDAASMETDDSGSKGLWIAEQAASCIEEMWNSPAVAVGLGASNEEQHQQVASLAGSTITGISSTALDRLIQEAAYSAQGLVLPRLAAAAQSLWHKIPKLGDLEGLASFLGWDHSAAQLDAHKSPYVLVPSEETALVQAFAVWVIEHQKSIVAKSKRVRNKKSKSDIDEEAQALVKMWQSSFVPLLTRSVDSPEKLLPLVYLATDAMDLQQLFDSNSTGVLREVTKTIMLVLERYGGNVSLARLAAAFLERVDRSRLLSASAMDQSLVDEDEVDADATVPGDLVCRAASTASSLLSTAVASVPETTASSHASAYSDVFACLVSLRAMIRSQDVSAFLTGVSIHDCGSLEAAEEHADIADRPTEAAFDQLLLLLNLAAKSGSGIRTIPEKTAIAALDTAYYFVLWRALKLDNKLKASLASSAADAGSGDTPGLWRRIESSARLLRMDRDRLVAGCVELADASLASYRRLRELAFATLGRLLKLFTGPLTRGVPNALGDAQQRVRDVRQSLVLARDVLAVRLQLTTFFERRLSEWAALVAGLLHPTDVSSDIPDAAWYADAPSSWSIAYARFCSMAALWAQWIGDQTISAEGLVTVARYTGMLGLESVEKRRLEQLASGEQAAPAADAPAANNKGAPKRKIGFVALSAFDHIVQAAVDALKPMLVLQSTRESAMGVYLAAMRACYERYAAADDASGALPVNSVNVGTLSLFIGSALKTAFVGHPQVPATPARGGRQAGDSGAFLLAPAVVGSAWTRCHEQAISYGLGRVAPNLFAEKSGAVHANMLDEDGDLIDEADGSERDPVSAEQWESLVEPWFAALSKTVSGIVRPRHAEVLSRHLERCTKKLRIAGVEEGEAADDAEYALAAIAPYQRSLDKELAKLGAIQARMAETRAAAIAAGDESVLGSPVPRAQLGSMLLSSPPMSPMPTSPTPARRTSRLAVGSDDEEAGAMDVDE